MGFVIPSTPWSQKEDIHEQKLEPLTSSPVPDHSKDIAVHSLE